MSQERAVLAGGCFWGMQDLIRKSPGVLFYTSERQKNVALDTIADVDASGSGLEKW